VRVLSGSPVEELGRLVRISREQPPVSFFNRRIVLA
jgi:hypothetical protein